MQKLIFREPCPASTVHMHSGEKKDEAIVVQVIGQVVCGWMHGRLLPILRSAERVETSPAISSGSR